MKSIEEEIKQKKFRDEFERVEVNLAYTAAFFETRFSAILKPYGISPQQFNILRILKGQHPNAVTLKSISERMLDKNSNTSRLIEKMRIKNLITRNICPDNRRQVDIAIIEKGISLINELTELVNLKRQGYINLTKEEASQLSGLLDKMRGG
ncbi:MAG: MarR family winged helix-turn-helix transcriptional regulator [Flavobacteriales bacterium]